MEHAAWIYKFLVLSLLIPQMNETVDKLGLPPTGVTHPRQLAEWDIGIVTVGTKRGQTTQYIRTKDYHFVFDEGGVYLCRLNTNGFEFWPDVYSDQGTHKTNVSPQLAYQLATNWLIRAGVDVPALEAKYQVEITQGYNHAKGESLVSPNFFVRWGGQLKNKKPGETSSQPIVEVKLDAVRQWLVSLSLIDMSYYRGPSPRLPNVWALSLLPDDPVLYMLTKPGVEYTNTFVLLEKSPEYEQERQRALRAELEHLVQVLELDTVNVQTEHYDTAYVNPPAFGRGGAFRSPQLTARFNPMGHLRELIYLPKPYTNEWTLQQQPSLLNSNQAYALACEKLTALGADWERINQELKFQGEQGRHTFREKKSYTQKATSEFRFYWGKHPAGMGPSELQVNVNGAIQRAVHLSILDPAYLGHPIVAINLATNAPVPTK